MKRILSEAQRILKEVEGAECCLKRVWRRRSLTIGFGNKIFHGDDSLIDDYRGEWEFRVYYSSWRIVQRGVIICASNDVVDTIGELQKSLDNIDLGKYKSINMLSEFDVSLELTNDARIDFLATDSDSGEEIVHIFCPNNFIGYSVAKNWYVSESDV